MRRLGNYFIALWHFTEFHSSKGTATHIIRGKRIIVFCKGRMLFISIIDWGIHWFIVLQYSDLIFLEKLGRRLLSLLGTHNRTSHRRQSVIHCPFYIIFGVVAQLIEHLPCTQDVAGLSPVGSTIWCHSVVVITPVCLTGDGSSILPGTAMQCSFNGRTSLFQSEDARSIRVHCSNLNIIRGYR